MDWNEIPNSGRTWKYGILDAFRSVRELVVSRGEKAVFGSVGLCVVCYVCVCVWLSCCRMFYGLDVGWQSPSWLT
jgi:hypothetical protein